MSKGIPITSGRGVQAVALIFAAALGVSAYLFATTGWGTPFPGCWSALPRPLALSVAALQSALAFGFVIAALRIPAETSVKDSLLVGMALALFSSLALVGAVYTLATGVARFGRSGCLEVPAPWSYAIGMFSILVGGLVLYAAAMVVTGRASSD